MIEANRLFGTRGMDLLSRIAVSLRLAEERLRTHPSEEPPGNAPNLLQDRAHPRLHEEDALVKSYKATLAQIPPEFILQLIQRQEHGVSRSGAGA